MYVDTEDVEDFPLALVGGGHRVHTHQEQVRTFLHLRREHAAGVRQRGAPRQRRVDRLRQGNACKLRLRLPRQSVKPQLSGQGGVQKRGVHGQVLLRGRGAVVVAFRGDVGVILRIDVLRGGVSEQILSGG